MLAPVSIPEVPENNSADGAGDETDRVGEKCLDDVVEVISPGLHSGEEDLVEDKCRGGGVEKELVPLDDGACHRGRDDLTQTRWSSVGLGCGGHSRTLASSASLTRFSGEISA
ncbi:Uncharacterised protein [Mycobacteroides abscessus subsp. abscessus]|nr:Uncharacterised protein [Mycobacteroides abscessus subsp. abscessus]